MREIPNASICQQIKVSAICIKRNVFVGSIFCSSAHVQLSLAVGYKTHADLLIRSISVYNCRWIERKVKSDRLRTLHPRYRHDFLIARVAAKRDITVRTENQTPNYFSSQMKSKIIQNQRFKILSLIKISTKTLKF